jgi:hypothetical protein
VSPTADLMKRTSMCGAAAKAGARGVAHRLGPAQTIVSGVPRQHPTLRSCERRLDFAVCDRAAPISRSWFDECEP